jgi:hypothetical protein
MDREENHMPMPDVRKDIRFVDGDFNTLFIVKDGESVKLKDGYNPNSPVKTLKCRWLDEFHFRLIGKHYVYDDDESREDYHIGYFAEMCELYGDKVEAIPGQTPMIDVLCAKNGEDLSDIAIPMTETEIKKLVGGKYETEILCDATKEFTFGVLLRGSEGAVICGIQDGALTSLHPYWAEKYKSKIPEAITVPTMGTVKQER